MSFFRPNSLPDNELIKIMEYIFEYFIIINKIFLCEWGGGGGGGGVKGGGEGRARKRFQERWIIKILKYIVRRTR